MKTNRHAQQTLEQISMDIQRVTRPAVIREEISEALARVAELREAGLHFEADFVESQIEDMEK